MKKLLAIVLSAVMAVSVSVSVSIEALAQENTKQTAYEITVDNPREELYDCIEVEEDWYKYDYEKWYKFRAPSNDWYELEVGNPYCYNNDGDTYITAYNEYGDEVAFDGVDEFSGKCAVYINCTSGAYYYFKISVGAGLWEDIPWTITVSAKKHTHNLKLDYSYSFSDYKEAEYSCRECRYNESSVIYAPKTVKLSQDSYVYDGKAKKPSVKVKDSKGNVIAPQYYSVNYSSGRKNVGEYSVTVIFKDDYSSFNSIKKSFVISPKGTSISKLNANKKGFTVKWKKQSSQTDGYEIQYSTSSKFKSAKTATVSKNKTTSKKITGLKGSKKYYVRIRTYKTVKGVKYYSSWSKTQSIKTKK